MAIESTGFNSMIPKTECTGLKCGSPSESTEMKGANRGQFSQSDQISFSPMSQLLNSIEGVDKTEMKDFRNEIRSSMQNGTFDAESMVEKAPESLKIFAEENGIDLAERFGQMSESAGQMSATEMHLKSPQTPDISAYFGQEENSFSDFLDTLFETSST
ncbi:MAG: hypothetical protein ISR69_15610 [Gammaproteobacteria bacterium]|nr:hypothetical protein [Gammaproteobacteria bacterium]